MKFTSKNSRFAKILAIVFSLLMIITATDVPMIMTTVALDANGFEVEVVNSESEKISGATVTITPAAAIGLSEMTAVTAENGIAVFSGLADYFADGGESFDAKYKVVATGYSYKEDTVTITAGGFTVEMNKNTISGIEITACDAVYDGNAHDAIVDIKGLQEGDTVSYSTDTGNEKSYSENIPQLTTPSDSKMVWVKIERAGCEPYEYSVNAAIKNRTFVEGVDFTITPYGPAAYNGSAVSAVTITKAPGFDEKGHEIYWRLADGNGKFELYDQERCRPVIEGTGKLKVVIRVVGKFYDTFEKEYTAEVLKGVITEEDHYTVKTLGVEELTYNGRRHIPVEVTAEKGFNVFYGTTRENIRFESPIGFTSACEDDAPPYEVYVKITSDNYDDKILGPYRLKINKADITGVEVYDFKCVYKSGEPTKVVPEFTGLIPRDAVWYSTDGDNYSKEALYVSEVAANDDTYTYYVKIDRGENYNPLELDFNVTVEKAGLEIAFDNAEIQETITYKENNYFTNVIATYTETSDDYTGESKDDLSDFITYSLVEDECTAEAEIDPVTGKVTYKTTGKIMVKAEIEEDLANYYLPDPAYYEIEVVYAKAPKISVTKPVIILPDGDETDKSKFIQWYKKADKEGEAAVTIMAAAEGWEIIEGSNKLGQETWAKSIGKYEGGRYIGVQVAFRNKAGEITALQTLAPFAIDDKAPQIVEIGIDKWSDAAEKVINRLSFGIFANDNVRVRVYVSDEEASSGIKEVSLNIYGLSEDATTVTVGADDIEKDDEERCYAEFRFPEADITEEGEESRVYVVTISAIVYDNTGNHSPEVKLVNPNSTMGEKGDQIMIEKIAPVISDTFHFDTDHGEVKTEAGNIYKDDVIGYIAVQDVHSGILSVEITDNGTPIHCCLNEPIEDEDDPDGATSPEIPQGITENISIKFYPLSKQADADGKHTIVVTVTDCAGNVSTKTGELFRDATAPVITDIAFAPIGGEAVDNEAVDTETEAVIVDDYGYYFNKGVIISVTAEDIASDNEMASGVKSITLKAVDISGKITEYRETIEENATVATVDFKIKKNFKGQIYVAATDIVGNNLSADKGFENEEGTYNPEAYNTAYAAIGDAFKGYVYPSGAIIEGPNLHSKSEHIEITLPETPYAQSNDKPLYNENTAVTVVVNDEYSGIRQVQVFADGEELDSVVLANSVAENKVGGWKITARGDRNLVTKMTKNVKVSINRNDIDFVVRITDRAGNVSEQSIIFGIDKTAPKISISYGSETHDEQYLDHFRTDRTATITIAERNFRASDVDFSITNTDGSIPGINLKDPSVWTTRVNKNNPDETTHTATVKFTAEGDYTFDVSYTDMANNKGNDVPAQIFTIDKTLPVVTVTYDNNSYLNGNYYKAKRTATITIKEHNFDASRAVVVGTSSDSAFPQESKWRSDGDVHTATISYTVDSKYTFDINFRDKAGNSIADFAQQEFYIDTTLPEVTLTGIVDKSANADSGNIGFVLSATDKNFDVFNPNVTAIVMEDGKFKSKTISVGAESKITNGKEYRVRNLEDDGIYSVSCTVIDKAGNAYTEVLIENNIGNMVKKACTQAGNIVTFSVNRNGSVFALDSYTEGLTKDYYVKDVTDFITIIEINADPITENSISINGKKLKEKTDYTVTLDNNSGSWYKYTYKVDKSVFETEGEYNVVVSSKDKAENAAYSDVKNAEVEFVVDRTAPVVTVSGLETDGKYRTSVQKVSLVPRDDGGFLKSITVRTIDEDGNVLKTLLKIEGDELDAAIAEGQLYFDLEEGVRQRVQIICEDFAGNISGMATEECFSNVTVSSNAFTIFWATDGFRWATIIGAALLAGIITTVVIKKRKKKAA